MPRPQRHSSSQHTTPPSVQHIFALMRQGLLFQAREMALGMLRRGDRSADLLLLLAAVHDQMGNLTATLDYVKQCVAVAPTYMPAITLHARTLHRMGRSAEAVTVCDAGLILHPNDEMLMAHKVEALDQSHRAAEAWQALEPRLSEPKVSPILGGLAARVLDGLGRREDAIAWARRAAEDPIATAEVSRINWMQVAKVLDKMGRYDDSFAAAQQAHARMPGAFDPAEYVRRMDNIVSLFSRSNLRMLARATDRSQLPVFLIGMPRSGTSLVEQIISSHPDVFGAGEIGDVVVIARSIASEAASLHAYPDSVADLTPEIANRLAARYLERLKELGGSAHRVTNKVMEQYEYVGLIWMLWPGARVIHVRRDPLDTCLSCFTRFLSSSMMPYVTSLEHLGLVYRQHERLMDHWRQVLDLPILTVQYEELIADQERLTRQIIEFLDLPWNDRCLRYWESERIVMTLSYDQVNRPIYDSSIGRWRHYEKHLAPLKTALSTGG